MRQERAAIPADIPDDDQPEVHIHHEEEEAENGELDEHHDDGEEAGGSIKRGFPAYYTLSIL
jgi:hypothetical protein